MKKLLFMLGFIVMLLPVLAVANEEVALDKAPIEPANQESLQRGARTFVNYCLNCHSANYMRYNRLVDIGLSEKQIKDNLLFSADRVGDPMKSAIDKKEAKVWLGVAPPDLSVEARARGADWIYTYMRSFYRDNSRPTGWNNVVYDKVAMPHVFWQLQGEQIFDHQSRKLTLIKPGTLSASEYDKLVTDLVNYMAFMAEPAKTHRQHMGWLVLLFLSVLLVLTYKLKKEFWRDIK